jgi:TPR repeat protein
MFPKSLNGSVAALLLLATLSATGQEVGFENLERLGRQETAGLRHYGRGNYEKAFESLSATAVRGMKESQYILSFMFLKGQHVDQSVQLGMAWLRVAIESGDPEWIELYRSLYDRLPEDQRQPVAERVARYIRQYGLVTQHVTCSRRPAAGSRRIESRCVKDTEQTYPLYPVELKPE